MEFSTPVYGQKKLLDTISKFTFDTMPNTCIFLGKQGCGKTLFSDCIAEKLHIEAVHIKKGNLPTAEQLLDYRISSENRLYVIDLRGLLEKEQNMFLKFIEEPTSNMKIIVIANSVFGVLPTILNRCTKYIFEAYSKEDLKNFAWMHGNVSDLYFTVCNTPGLFICNSPQVIEDLYKKCVSFLENIHTMNYATALSFCTNVNYKDTYDKADPEIFFILMHYIATEEYKKNNSDVYFNTAKLTSDYLYQVATIPTLVKENLVLSYLTSLWEATR